VVNPFETISIYGPDVVRWYLIENAPPWDNLKFNSEGIVEAQRRFFGTLLNTYSFFALYANIDGYAKDESNVSSPSDLTYLDKWILSKLQTLIGEVAAAYDEYEPTRAARAIQEFVNDHLSNWYIRLNRKRFWKGEMSDDKRAAYDTLFECLLVTAQLMSPISPFFSEWLYKNLTDAIRSKALANNTPLRFESVHLTLWTEAEEQRIDKELEKSMDYAQKICSLVHSIRKNAKIKVRTPLQKIVLPILDESFAARIKAVEDIILAEVNVKAIEYMSDTSGVVVKKIKPNFPKLGKQYGPRMKEVSAVISSMDTGEIALLEKQGSFSKEGFEFTLEDVIISSEDIPGWAVASDAGITVALDLTLTDALRQEGIARDFVNRVQNLRKDMGLEVLDKITIEVQKDSDAVLQALTAHSDYIRTETQALALNIGPFVDGGVDVAMDEHMLKIKISVSK